MDQCAHHLEVPKGNNNLVHVNRDVHTNLKLQQLQNFLKLIRIVYVLQTNRAFPKKKKKTAKESGYRAMEFI